MQSCLFSFTSLVTTSVDIKKTESSIKNLAWACQAHRQGVQNERSAVWSIEQFKTISTYMRILTTFRRLLRSYMYPNVIDTCNIYTWTIWNLWYTNCTHYLFIAHIPHGFVYSIWKMDTTVVKIWEMLQENVPCSTACSKLFVPTTMLQECRNNVVFRNSQFYVVSAVIASSDWSPSIWTLIYWPT